jgi:dolichyl-phosphate-mannose-protein mannosyltransferase
MSSPSPSLRKRGGKKDAYTALPSDDGSMTPASRPGKAGKPQSEWDYWLAMIVLTVLAFATRFYRIDYPNEVVFDEVHFGKVCAPTAPQRLRHRGKGGRVLD